MNNADAESVQYFISLETCSKNNFRFQGHHLELNTLIFPKS